LNTSLRVSFEQASRVMVLIQRLAQQRHVVAELVCAIDQGRALLSRWRRIV